jgi:poly-gamma-glutamate capsule biosynthesis protein CapA/YwtB (metallophosphatase superfamily)
MWGSLVALLGAIGAVGAANVVTGDTTSTTLTAGTTTTLASGTTTVPSSSTTTTAPITKKPAMVTLSAVGDTELGDSPRVPASPTAYFAPVKAAMAAPIVFGNLEGTLTSAKDAKCAPGDTECFAFRVPTSFANVYRSVGFTVMNSANNHSHDFGTQGVLQTSAALRAAGIAQAGLPGQIAVVREGTTKVAFVDFAPYANTNNLLNYAVAHQLIAKARHLATVVVVYMHAGAEGSNADHVTRKNEYYVGEDRGNPYLFAHDAINDGADLVIASGPHVLRGMEWYHGHLIAYSLGDFENYENFAASGDLVLSGILHVSLTSTGAFVSGAFTSVRLSSIGQAFVDPTHASAAFVNQLSREDFGQQAAIIESNGTIRFTSG